MSARIANPMMARKLALLFWVATTCSGPLTAMATAAAVAPPSVDVLVQRVVARDAETQKELQSMQYKMHSHTEQVDETGNVIHHEDLEMVVMPGAAQPYHVISITGDKIAKDPDQAASGAKSDAISQSQHAFDLKALATRFNVTYGGSTTFKDQKCYILSFSPKDNQEAKDDTEKVVNRLHGQIWVREKDDVILQTQATLSEPVDVVWFLARVRALDFHYELQSTTSLYAPAAFQINIEITAPLIHVRQRQSIAMSDCVTRVP